MIDDHDKPLPVDPLTLCQMADAIEKRESVVASREAVNAGIAFARRLGIIESQPNTSGATIKGGLDK